MPFIEKRLTNPTTLSTVASTMYTVPSQYKAIVKQVVVTNTTASAASFNLYIGTASAANAVFSNTTVAANDTLIINLSQVLNATEVLTANASSNSSLNFTISGVENDGPLSPSTVYLPDGSITTSKLADNSVTTVKIGANTVTQTKLSTDIPLSGFRNIIINGDMRINQRTSSYTTVGYTLDRWYMGVTGAYTVSQSSSSPPTGFQNFMRVQRTNGSSNTGVPQITQSLETRDSIPFQGKTVTVSFYARAGANYSPSGNILNWRIYGGTGTDQNVFSYTGQATPVDQSVVLTTSWQRFTYTVSSLTSYNEYGLFFFCTPTGTAGVNDYFDITGIQMEIGPQATPFEQRHYGAELALCQRYYEKSYADGTAVGANTSVGTHWQSSFGNASGVHWITVRYQVPKRANPTVSLWTQSGSAGGWVVVSNPQPSGFAGSATITGLTTKSFTVQQSDGGYAWQGGISGGHWEAAIEL